MGPDRILPYVIGLLLLTAHPLLAQSPEDVSDTEQNGVPSPEIHFQVGYNAYHEGDLHRALRRLTRSLASDTRHERARYWLGKTHYALGNNQRALKLWAGAGPLAERKDWFERERRLHRIRYARTLSHSTRRWRYVGLVEGKRYGRERNVNPSVLEPAPGGGWYSASYRTGKVLRYSPQGRVLEVWRGFKKPVDLTHVSGEGLYVVEFERDRIRLLSDTGGVRPFAKDGLHGPDKLFVLDGRKYVVNFGSSSITQLGPTGETVATVYRGPPGSHITGASPTDAGRIWVLEDERHHLLQLDRYGRVLKRIRYDPDRILSGVWWQRGRLLVSSREGLFEVEPSSGRLRPLRDEKDVLPGEDVSDLLIRGNQLVLSMFETSQILIYRMPGLPDPDILVQDRRIEFEDFPVIRVNLTVQDPFWSGRFHDLTDRNLGVTIDRVPVRPSILKPARTVYAPRWILIVDNRIRRRRRWEEIRPTLQKLITRAPTDSLGSVWTVAEDRVNQDFTKRRVNLRNALSEIRLQPGKDAADNALSSTVHRALDRLFGHRGPGGLIVVSRRIHDGSDTHPRLAHRLRNNAIPMTVINPSTLNLADTRPLIATGRARYMNFDRLSVGAAWRTYADGIRSHYTAIFQETLPYQKSAAWRPFEFALYYYDRVHRFDGAYLLP